MTVLCGVHGMNEGRESPYNRQLCPFFTMSDMIFITFPIQKWRNFFFCLLRITIIVERAYNYSVFTVNYMYIKVFVDKFFFFNCCCNLIANYCAMAPAAFSSIAVVDVSFFFLSNSDTQNRYVCNVLSPSPHRYGGQKENTTLFFRVCVAAAKQHAV